MNDERLVADARNGDEGAFEELFTRHQRRLLSLALRYRLPHQDAEDAVQQTMVKAWLRLHTFRAEARFSTWLTRVLMNEVLQIRRKQSRMRIEEMESDGALTAALESGGATKQRPLSQEQRLFLLERNRLVRAALRSLPESLRSVLSLQVFQERTLEEIAAQLNHPVATIKSRRHRARLEIRKRFGQRLRGADLNLASL